MKLIKNLVFFVLLIMFVSCSSDDGTNDIPEVAEEVDSNGNPDNTPTILSVTGSLNSLSVFNKALLLADDDLKQMLANDEDIKTLFAPTAKAFSDLLQQLDSYGSLEDFNTEEGNELLNVILRYHIIAGTRENRYKLTHGRSLQTVQSEKLHVEQEREEIYLRDKSAEKAKLIGDSHEVSDGVVHVIDKVLLPDEIINELFPNPSLAELAKQTEEISLFYKALEKADLTETLANKGPFTVFAPTDDAIEELFDLLGVDSNSLDNLNIIEVKVLEEILLYHIAIGDLALDQFSPILLDTLLDGETLVLVATEDDYVLSDASNIDANMLQTDLEAANGRMHIIDKILIPEGIQEILTK